MTGVLFVAYPFSPVHPDAVGGAEQILSLLEAGLARAGLATTTIACAGSRVQGTLIETASLPAQIDDEGRSAVWARTAALIADRVHRGQCDLVHMHGIDFFQYLPPPRVPVVVTLHLPLDWYPAEILALRGVTCVCVSQTQRRAGGERWAGVPVVNNGVVTGGAPPGRRRQYALALGRVCPEKGLHDAVEAARLAGVPLGIGGQVFPYPAHQAYFRDLLAPRLDRARRFLGPVAGRRKRRLIGSARCLVVPSLVPETSSLVAMEALAAGTPVVARRVGALPDLIDHGRTGFLVEDVPQMAAAIRACEGLDPEDCRAAARSRFSAARMIEDYVQLFNTLSGGRESPAFVSTP